MGRATGSKVSQPILDEAAEWFVEIEGDEVSLQRREQFDEWLRRSPEHVRAFLELLPVWEGVAATRSAADPTAQELIEQFLNARPNVVPLREDLLESPAQSTPPHQIARRSRRGLWSALAAGLIGFGVFAGFQVNRDTYSTGIGEQRSLTLDDGSQLELNARSRVRIDFNAHERAVVLLEGQAFFQVAKDPARPFVVHSDGARIRAVGTQFDVYRKQSGTVVTVVEGRVSVRNEDTTDSAVELAPGQQVIVRLASAPIAAMDANVSAAIGWTQQRLTFKKTTLAEVADEFNRYNKRPLHVEGAMLRNFRVSGTFASANPSALLLFLRSQPGVEIIESAQEVRIVAKESPPQP